MLQPQPIPPFSCLDEEFLNILLDKMTDAFALHRIILDSQNKPCDYEFIRVNKSFELNTGFKASDIIGRRILEIAPDIENYWIENYGKVALTGEVLEFENYSKTLKKSFFCRAYQPRHGFFAVIFTDISNRLEQEKKEKILLEKLKSSEKLSALGELSSGVAHDYNNHIAGILGYASLITHHPEGSEKIKYYAKMIIQSAQHSADLSNRLLDFSRKSPTKVDSVDIEEVLRETLALCHRRIQDHAIIQHTEFLADHTRLRGNKESLLNAFLNIIINACDAMTQGGHLLIRTRNTLTEDDLQRLEFNRDMTLGAQLVIEIKDTGCGIDPEKIKRIFDPYFTTKGKKGTGLGLSSSYTTMQQHLAQIDVSSLPGIGTHFLIYFPIQDDNKTYLQMKNQHQNTHA